MSGRYVIVQMNNGENTPLNLKEVKAFGKELVAPTYWDCCLTFQMILQYFTGSINCYKISWFFGWIFVLCWPLWKNLILPRGNSPNPCNSGLQTSQYLPIVPAHISSTIMCKTFIQTQKREVKFSIRTLFFIGFFSCAEAAAAITAAFCQISYFECALDITFFHCWNINQIPHGGKIVSRIVKSVMCSKMKMSVENMITKCRNVEIWIRVNITAQWRSIPAVNQVSCV